MDYLAEVHADLLGIAAILVVFLMGAAWWLGFRVGRG